MHITVAIKYEVRYGLIGIFTFGICLFQRSRLRSCTFHMTLDIIQHIFWLFSKIINKCCNLLFNCIRRTIVNLRNHITHQHYINLIWKEVTFMKWRKTLCDQTLKSAQISAHIIIVIFKQICIADFANSIHPCISLYVCVRVCMCANVLPVCLNVCVRVAKILKNHPYGVAHFQLNGASPVFFHSLTFHFQDQTLVFYLFCENLLNDKI